jgi:folate-dependent phosphoribosylglycinamide formyltransferase PurN
MAHQEFKSAIYLKEFLFSELASEISEIIIVEQKKVGFCQRIKQISKKDSLLSVIKNNIIAYNHIPALKEVLLSFLDHVFCSLQSFFLKFYPNYFSFKYSLDDRKFIRMKKIIKYLDQHSVSYKKTKELNSDATLKILETVSPDFIVLAGTGVVSNRIISCASKAVLNCHSSILPGYRGINSEHFALLDNRPDLLGHSVHRVTQEIDAGEIYVSKRINYDKMHDNQFSLRYKNIVKGAQSLIKVIQNFENINPQQNDTSKSVYRNKSSFFSTYQLMKRLNDK